MEPTIDNNNPPPPKTENKLYKMKLPNCYKWDPRHIKNTMKHQHCLAWDPQRVQNLTNTLFKMGLPHNRKWELKIVQSEVPKATPNLFQTVSQELCKQLIQTCAKHKHRNRPKSDPTHMKTVATTKSKKLPHKCPNIHTIIVPKRQKRKKQWAMR